MGKRQPDGWPARAGRMRDPAFRAEQLSGRYAPHVAALNRFVDTLGREGGRAPAVPPLYGGSSALVVNVVGPPPAHGGVARTAFACWENDDEQAARHRCLSHSAGLSESDVVDWPVLPWPVGRPLTAGELDQGRRILLSVLGLLTAPRVVLFHGPQAGRLRRTLDRFGPGWDTSRGISVLDTDGLDPADDPLDPQERLARLAGLVAAYDQAGRILGRTGDPDSPCLAQLARRLAADPAVAGDDPAGLSSDPAGVDALVTAVAEVVGVRLEARRPDGAWSGRFTGPAAWWGREIVVRRLVDGVDPPDPADPAQVSTGSASSLTLIVTVTAGTPARLYRPGVPPRLRRIDLLQASRGGAVSRWPLYPDPSVDERPSDPEPAQGPSATGQPDSVLRLGREQRHRLDRYAAED